MSKRSKPGRIRRKSRGPGSSPGAGGASIGEGPRDHSTPSNRERWIAIAILAAALIVRLLYLFESSDSPAFLVPLVDAAEHRDLANRLLATGAVDELFFKRPLFYPLFLSGLFALSGSSILFAKIVQAVLGALTCWLTYRLARHIFDPATGVLAAILVIFCGPLIFWETELVAAGWAALWSVATLIVLLRAEEERTPLWLFLYGACGALAIITRADFLFFILVASVWLVARLMSRKASTEQKIRWVASPLLGFLLVCTPILIQSHRVLGYASFIPRTGGINAYIGNNPDRCATLRIRPSDAYVQLMRTPMKAGYLTPREQSKFFMERVVSFARNEPALFLHGLTHKAVQLANGREVPRNVDIYAFREWSTTLRALVWKVGRFGFPWGVLLPLALFGILAHWRSIPRPLLFFVALYPLLLIGIFISGRYRVPMLPVFSVLAAAGVLHLVRAFRAAQWGTFYPSILGLLACIALLSLPAPACEEELNYAAELRYLLGTAAMNRGAQEEAAPFMHQALALEPELERAHTALGQIHQVQGRYAEALPYLDESLRLQADASVYYRRGTVYRQQGNIESALRDFEAAIAVDPEYIPALYDRGVARTHLRQIDAAIAAFEEVIEVMNSSWSPPGWAKYRQDAESSISSLREVKRKLELLEQNPG